MAGNNVPGLDTNTPQFSEQVPGAQIPLRAQAGKEGEGYENFGQSIERATGEAASIYDSVQTQHDISIAGQAETQTVIAHSQKLQQLKLTSPDGFMHDPDTGEIIKQSDGSQRTIAHEYWDWADQDYQGRQQDMTPRAAAMYRNKAQERIAGNTQILQNEGLTLQTKAANQAVDQNAATLARANDNAPWDDHNPYYSEKQPDGAVLLRGNTDKINDQLRMLKLQTAQQGPTKDAQGNLKAGVYGPTDVQKITAERLATHSDNWTQSALTDIMENDGPRDKRNAISATALQQLYGLRDIVEGKDKQSRAAERQGLPTVHSSLSSDQIDKWRAKIDAMKPDAMEVDKHEYTATLKLLNDSAHNVTSVRQFVTSDLFNHVLHSGKALQVDDNQRVGDLVEPFSQAVMSSAISKANSLSSLATKQALVAREMKSAQTYFPQLAQTLGMKDTKGFGEAITAKAQAAINQKLNEEDKQARANPMGFAAQLVPGPGGSMVPRRPMARAIEDQLDPRNPELLQMFKPMGNGKSAFDNAYAEGGKTSSTLFNHKSDVVAFQPAQLEDQKNRILNARTPEMLEEYFVRQLGQQKSSDAQKQAYLQQLVKAGLPKPYVDALNLQTAPERAARWAGLLAGASDNKDLAPDVVKNASKFARQDNADFFKTLDLRAGPDSFETSRQKDNYLQSWQRDYLQEYRRSQNEQTSRDFANGQREKTTGSVGVVGATHNLLGFHWGHPGAQVPISFDRTDLSPDQKQGAQQKLLQYQSEDELAKHQFVAPPNAPAENPNMPLSKWISNHLAMWERSPMGDGYRLSMKEMTKGGLDTGKRQWLRLQTGGYYDVKDRDLGLPPAKLPGNR